MEASIACSAIEPGASEAYRVQASDQSLPPVAAQSESSIAGMMKRVQEKGKIFNPAPEPKREPSMAATGAPAKISDVKKPEVKDDDDDWGAIPAFLRRSRLK